MVGFQGTLDTVPVPQLLRLGVTGRLRIESERGGAEVWLSDGMIVSASAELLRSDADPADVVFDLLRSSSGWFGFDAGLSTSHRAGPGHLVEDVLAVAEERLAEWRSIEAVVPSLASPVHLVPELNQVEVEVDGAQWRAIIATAQEGTVAAVGDRLDTGEVETSVALKELVEVGLVHVEPPPRSLVPAERPRRRPAPGRSDEELAALGTLAEPPWQFSSPGLVIPETTIDLSTDRRTDAAPEWATEERLERAFADWVPGAGAESDGAPKVVALTRREDRGLLGKLLGSLRS